MDKNIALILLDQVRTDMLGAYGHNIVKTPNIDSIARDGMTFDQAYTPAAVCCPARTSLFTGQMPTNHKITRNVEKAAIVDPCKENPNIISALDEHNHLYIGKWHIGGKVLPRDFGFKGHNFDGYGYPGGRVYGNLVFDSSPKQEDRYIHWLKEKGFEVPYVTEAYFGENPHLQIQELYGLLHCPKEATLPYFVVEEAIDYIKKSRLEKKEFFIWLNFWGPHTPCVIPEPFYSMYNPKDVILEKSFYNPLENRPLYYEYISKMWGVRDASEEKWKEIITKFWGYITLIDEAIGIFIKFLKEEGLYEDIFLAVTADHGDAMGAHRLIEKGEFMLDKTYRIPMIIKSPEVIEKGSRNDEFVYLHDLTPTCSEFAGKEINKFFDGKSMIPILKNEDHTERKGILAQLAGHFVSFEQRMWRRKDYKLVFNASDKGELYNMEADPEEITNLFYEDKYKDIKKEMLNELYSEMQKIKDPLANWLYRIIDLI